MAGNPQSYPPSMPAAADKPTPKSKGCLFWGCLTAIVLLILVIALVAGGTYFVRQKVRAFTDDHPKTIPIAAVAPAEKQRLAVKVKAFQAALNTGARREFSFTADEVNKLIAMANDARFKGKVFVHIDGDRLSADASLPLNAFPGMRGRYLNGRVTLDVRIRDGRLEVFPVAIVVKGKPLPPQFMAQIKAKNLAENYQTDPRTRETLEKIESLEIKDGKIIITTRRSSH